MAFIKTNWPSILAAVVIAAIVIGAIEYLDLLPGV